MLTKLLHILNKIPLKHRVLLGLVGSLLLILAVQSLLGWFGNSPIRVDEQPYPDIVVSQSTRLDIIESTDEMPTEYQDGDWNIVTLPSAKSPYKPDRFYLSGDIVMMKEQWFEPIVYAYPEDQLRDTYGQPQRTMFVERVSDVPVKALLYPDSGMAAYIYTDDQMVSHIQFFAPMSMDEYLKQWGEGLIETKPTPRQPASHDGE